MIKLLKKTIESYLYSNFLQNLLSAFKKNNVFNLGCPFFFYFVLIFKIVEILMHLSIYFFSLSFLLQFYIFSGLSSRVAYILVDYLKITFCLIIQLRFRYVCTVQFTKWSFVPRNSQNKDVLSGSSLGFNLLNDFCQCFFLQITFQAFIITNRQLLLKFNLSFFLCLLMFFDFFFGCFHFCFVKLFPRYLSFFFSYFAE